MKKYRSSPARVTLAYVVSASPGVAFGASPQSTPGGRQSRVSAPGSHLRPMSRASPVYSPGLAAPSSAGTLGAAGVGGTLGGAGIVVLGTMPSVKSSKPDPPLS